MQPAPWFDEVLTEARRGDPAALGDLWRRYSPSVLAYARSRGAAEPEEVTSEVFLGVFQRLGDFRGDEDAFRGLLYTVAQRRVVDEHRRRSSRPPTVPWHTDEDADPLPSAEDHVLQRLGDSWALQVVAALAPDQADVLLLRIFGDLTMEQIAAALGKRVGAVKALQRRGLATLRRQLADRPPPRSVPAATHERRVT